MQTYYRYTKLLIAIIILLASCRSGDEATPMSDEFFSTSLIAVRGDRSANLYWTGSASVTYSILRGTGSGIYESAGNNIKGTHYTDKNLINGTIYYYIVSAKQDNNLVKTNEVTVTPVQDEIAGSVKWPLSAGTSNNADGIRYPMAARFYSNTFDFHAGVDIPAPNGTNVYPVVDGTVTKIQVWDGKSPGSGNYVLVRHGNSFKWTTYQHLNDFATGLAVGQFVKAGETLLGHVGHSGADKDHLHFNYMVGLTSETMNESKARNPLELLPHTQIAKPTAAFRTDGSNKVDIQLSTQLMTVRWVILKGKTQIRTADYYEIVSRGSMARNVQDQSGIHFEVSELKAAHPATDLVFTLTLSPDLKNPFEVQQVILKDFDGKEILNSVKP